ncbi:SUF system Fe-S cluster assembly regulator [Curvivirga aplysinae]|uniref:SUF system Fe-S cluster assembly regulator n=1 Tax=Curvivirga aplysinae TaxID=2529852 RepID=UPI002E257B26|nr:SUF system Fe-S cluster assembly regulator [Curvivirga aplysinae]
MFRLSKLTDYGVIVLGQMADLKGENTTAPDLAEVTKLPQPTVAKILKLLAKANVIVSKRGAGGGYALERSAEQVSVAEVIAALDGPVALTACVDGAEGACDVEDLCPMRGRWDPINMAVKAALESVSLADINKDAGIPDFINMNPLSTGLKNSQKQKADQSALAKDQG